MVTESGTSESDARVLDLRDYLRILRRRWRVIVLSVLVVVGAVVGLSLAQTKVYEATAEVLIKTRPSEQVFSGGTNEQLNAQRDFDTELEVMLSGTVEADAKERLGREPDIEAKAVGVTDVVAVTAKSTDPRHAAEDARVYAESYIRVRRAQSVQDLVDTANEIQIRLNDVEARLGTLPEDSPERPALQTQQAFFRDQLSQFSVATGVAQVGAGTLVTKPTVPSSPAAPTPLKNGLIAGFIGLMLGFAFAFLREYLDDSVKTKTDLQIATGGLPVLGLIPAAPGWRDQHEAYLVAREQPTSPAAESYRTLRTAVQFLALEHPMQVLQITSAASSEGKTTTLVNLGVALTHADQKVILVDCDLRRPRLHEFFGLDNTIGFTSVLLGDVPLSQAVRTVPDSPGLALLTSGPRPPDPSELLSLPSASGVIETLRGHCDTMIVDSPPVLPVSDPLVLSSYVDGTLVVAKAGVTSKRSLHRAIEMLQQVDAPVLGTVLNHIQSSMGGYEYAYVYGAARRGERRTSRDATSANSAKRVSQAAPAEPAKWDQPA